MNPFIHISFQVVFSFEGWLFEYDRRKPHGPWPLKKDYEPRLRAGDKFYSMFGRFLELSIDDQDTHRL